MIKLNDGAGSASVLAVKLRLDYDGKGIQGTVLAVSQSEFVTWRVSSFNGGETYDAYSGHYLAPGDKSPEAYILHLKDFNER